jgi:hypothetical protein
MARAKRQAAVEETAVTEPLTLEEEVTAVTPVEEVAAPAEPTVPEKPVKRPSPPPAEPDPNALVMVRVVGVDEIVIGQTAYMRDETARVRHADYLAAAAAHPVALLVKLPGSQEYTK